MVQSAAGQELYTQISAIQHDYVKAFRWMLLARVLDDKFASLYRGGKIHGGVFLGRGQEALSAASGQSLQRGDIFAL
jgi:pyruvate dehydrogenase E1 component alpha subunit/2-oxoisovalerate dehydrogenase E1 component alpha subunit